jgi:hypothetical protein
MLMLRSRWWAAAVIVLLLADSSAWSQIARYEGDGLIVFVERTAQNACRGEIQMGGAIYPFTARLDGPRIAGQFEADGKRFDFDATLDDEGMILQTGGERYRLKFVPGQAPDGGPRPPQPGPAEVDGQGLERLPWMKPGMRFTYYESSMSQSLFGVELEPDENGEWVDRRDPKRRFSENTVLRGGAGGGAGYGLRQHDIVAVEDGVIACDTKVFSTRADLNAHLLLPGGSSVIGTYQNGLEVWIHPRLLAKQLADAEAAGDRQAPTQVYRTRYETMNRQWDAVRIITRVADGMIHQTYDLETGILLYASSALVGQNRDNQDNVRHKDDGRPWVARGQTTFTYTKLLNIRELKLPAGIERTPLPAIYRQGNQFQWQGGVKMHVPGAENLNAPPQPVAWGISILKSGKTYAVAAVKDISPGAIDVGLTPPCRAVGPASLGGWVMSPAIFQNLQPNQVLDRDPVSQNEIVYLGQQNGLHWVQERGPAHQYTYGYDPQSGVAVRVISTIPSTGLTYDVQLIAR